MATSKPQTVDPYDTYEDNGTPMGFAIQKTVGYVQFDKNGKQNPVELAMEFIGKDLNETNDLVGAYSFELIPGRPTHVEIHTPPAR